MAPALAAGLVACSGGAKGDCTQLVDGEWTFDGTALGMPMGAIVTVDAAGCSFAVAEWTMEMATLPGGGTVDGDEITLSGDDAYWSSCTGTVNAAGDAADGICDEDGGTWSMTAK
jgi:hypothetical protein